MSGIRGSYFPVYPEHDCLPDPEIRAFITNFYKVSDRQDANELWISHFTSDAEVLMGNDGGKGVAGKLMYLSQCCGSLCLAKTCLGVLFPISG